MKIVLAIVVIILLAGGAFLYMEKRKTDQAILDLKNRKDQTIKLDSVRTAIETKIFDSVAVVMGAQSKKIKVLESEQKRLRNDNAELQKKVNSIRVSMPEF